MGNGHLIFSAIFVAGFIVLLVFLRRKSRRCRWCRTPTVKLDALPERERSRIEKLVREEGMDPSESYEFCMTCRRIFDQWWFHRDWDMRDRWCACGSSLKFPWDVDTNRLRQAAADLPREVIGLLLDRSSREDIARLLGGYDDIMYREEKRPGGHALKVCDTCHRMYMWIEVNGYLVFQCVSAGRDKYDRDLKPSYDS